MKRTIEPGQRPPTVYVAGPFSGVTREHVEANIRAAEQYGLDIAELGAMPVVPHCMTAHPTYEMLQDYDFWISGTLAVMCTCDAVFFMPNWRASKGACKERASAEKYNYPVFDSLILLGQWIDNWYRYTRP